MDSRLMTSVSYCDKFEPSTISLYASCDTADVLSYQGRNRRCNSECHCWGVPERNVSSARCSLPHRTVTPESLQLLADPASLDGLSPTGVTYIKLATQTRLYTLEICNNNNNNKCHSVVESSSTHRQRSYSK